MADVAYVQRTAGDNKGPWVVGVCAGAISFTAVAVALRCWSRTLTKAGFWWDDWTILISLVSWYSSIIFIPTDCSLSLAVHLGPAWLAAELGICWAGPACLGTRRPTGERRQDQLRITSHLCYQHNYHSNVGRSLLR